MLNAAFKDTLFVVSDEMRATLRDIKAALELAIETRDNKHLAMVRELLHSAKGALQVIDFNASAMLAQEMIEVVDGLLERKNIDRDSALQAISTGVVTLPSFFNKTIELDGKEHSIALLPVLQELRAARQGKPLSEDTLLLLDVKNNELSDKTIQMPKLKPELDLRLLIGKYRSIFQTSLLGWIKDKDSSKHLTRLAVITEKFEQAAKEERAFKLWWVTGGLIEAMIEGGLKSSPDLRRLLGQVDRAGKLILDKGEAFFQENTDRSLINQLLYFINRSTSEGKRVSEIRQAFSLNDSLKLNEKIDEAKKAMAAPDTEVMQSLSLAIKEDLDRVKDTLDIFNRTGTKDNLQIEQRFESLKKIADTLNMLGLPELEKRVLQQQKEISTLLSRNETITENHMIGVAASLLLVESRLEEELDKLAGKRAKENPKFLQDALHATYRETKVNLARVKEVINQFMRDPTDIKPISRAPLLLKDARAASQLADKERLAVILGRLQDYITRHLIGSGRLPYSEHLELLAGAIESVDFYLETLNKGRRDPWYMLDNADSCLDQLLRDAPKPLPESGSAAPGIEKTMAMPVLSESDMASTAVQAGSGTVAMPALTAADIQQMQNTSHVAKEQFEHPDAYPVMDQELQTDPEVIEIFIEEAKEVSENIKRDFDIWLHDHSQREALVAVRRGYHTLKGSGRMVGARRMGEFAWSVENLINRTLEGTVQIDDDGIHLLQRSVMVIPSLIEQLESGAETQEDAHQLMLSLESYTEQKLAQQVDRGDITHLPGQIEKIRELTDTQQQPVLKMDSDSAQSSDGDEDKPHTQIIDMREMLKQGFNPNQNAAAAQHTQIMDMRDVIATGSEQATVVSDSLPIAGTQQTPIIHPPRSYQLESPLYDIYMDESGKHLSVVKAFCQDSLGEPVSNGMHRAVHTLHGSANMAELHPITTLAAELERYVQRMYDEGLPIQQNALNTICTVAGQLESMIATINTPELMPSAPAEIFTELAQLHTDIDVVLEKMAREGNQDDDGLELDFSVLDEVITEDSEASSDSSRFSDSQAPTLAEINENIPDTLVSSSAEPKSDSDALLSQGDLEEIFGATSPDVSVRRDQEDQNFALDNSDTDTEVAQETEQLLDELEVELDDILIVADSKPATPVVEEHAPTMLAVDSEITNIFLEEAEEIIAETDAAVASWDDETGLSEDKINELQRQLHTLKGGARMAGLLSMGDFTHEIESFVLGLRNESLSKSSAARKLLQSSVDHLHTMLADVQGGEPPTAAPQILEQMHALITGDDSGVESDEPATGEIVTSLVSTDAIQQETDQVPVAGLDSPKEEVTATEHGEETELEFSDESIQEVLERTDTHKVTPVDSDELIESDESENIAIDDAAAETQEEAREDFAPVLPTVIDDTYAVEAMPNVGDGGGDSQAAGLVASTDQVKDAEVSPVPVEEQAADSIFDYAPQVVPVHQRQQDAARISTSNLETLLNQAGEISIFRSRIEQELSNANLNLAELARTVQRVREQLRKMEIETEATILFQHRDETENSDFDPLEMDRYSNVQQVSRALAESVNDLQSLETLLETQFRETESLLLQQSRVMTDLQDNLMRVRMVPFAKYAPRYARVVRQIAGETGKEVELNVVGADSEIDRQVIERMQAPLEHMIRNAVVHGIEKPENRTVTGKDPEGTIELRLSREGAQLIMEMEDDGAGLDLEAIRNKAINLGMLDEDQQASDADLANLILNSGFSTATHVTQNAGRGVGMDVVASEIKQLGGSLQITTEKGKGTRFLMRLPYTRAINHALLVRCGDENYAIPIHKVDGVAKMSLHDLQKLLDSDDPVYRYADQDYEVKMLSQLVGAHSNVTLDPDEPQHSVIMVTGGDHHAALVINELIGSREMVIKPVGPQIAAIKGISGATILGDGRIVIILDMDALLGVQLHEVQVPTSVTPQAQQPLILVVDDSITVRRVTERLLERNKMEVLTARDGLDALGILQEHEPDLILMDIEMPRMDGYELAEHVRKDARISDIPIIMITSRTGDKHRQRAIEIGVDDYLGKPYREDQLLEAIQPHLSSE